MKKIYIKLSDNDSTLRGIFRDKFKKKRKRNKNNRPKFKPKSVAAPKDPGIDGVTPIEVLHSRRQSLRANATASERIFKNRLKAAGIEFIFQCIAGFYIPDFVIRCNSVIVELDGASHNESKEYDARRDAFLTSCGFHVLRINNDQASSYSLDSILALKGSKPLGTCLSLANSRRNKVMIRNRKKAALCDRPRAATAGPAKPPAPLP